MNYIHTIRVGDRDYVLSDPNAVTHQALEENNRTLLELLCPPFRESGKAVRCRPVRGYPVTVTTELPAGEPTQVTLTQEGKNLFDPTQYPMTNIMISRNGGVEATASTFSAFKKYLPVSQLRGQTITLNHPPAELTASTNACLAFYDENKTFISGDSGYTHVVPDNASFLRFSVPRQYADGTDVQLELGGKVTQYAPYRQPVTYTAEAEGGSYRWEGVQPFEGDNTFYSTGGDTTAQGLSDPLPLLERSQNV